MLFNSLDFAFFLPIVFILYWYVAQKNVRRQNLLLIFASYFFYACWDWRFLSLIIFSTVVDYLIGLKLKTEQQVVRRKLLLGISLFSNLGLLGLFKYYDFFIANFAASFSIFGFSINPASLNLILPLGISFYTFQTLSYSIDVYKGRIKASHDFIEFSAFVCFFPQLVAGPIERASHLLPQLKNKRLFNYHEVISGSRQILWGLFKKIVIADNCAKYANYIFDHSTDLNGSTLLLGAFFFSFQIYGDFSGYTDIAIGSSRLFGIKLSHNFSYPYFSRDIAEFWRRWHISLSSWFRDYVYIPLGGSRNKKYITIRNILIVFLVCGFWHGAKWTFIFWGLLHALYYLPLLLFNRNRKNIDIVASDTMFPSLKELLKMSFTFTLVGIAWIFFRADDISHALAYISEVFSSSLFSWPYFKGISMTKPILILLTVFTIIEWLGRKDEFAIENILLKIKTPLRLGVYYAIVFAIFYFGGSKQEFIYFQF
jgi:D-alanyl-lipoteichoic acid acyltransferase DltB (MBOAT superfamily)